MSLGWRFILGAGLLCWGTSYALSWSSFWHTADQQAEKLWKEGQFKQAADLFDDPAWRATAAYRSGDYARAVQNFMTLQSSDGFYNAGNALAQSHQYQAAIQAYDQALAHDPNHSDALFNRQLVQKLLEQQKQSQPNQPSASQQAASSSAKKGTEEPQAQSSEATQKKEPKSPTQSPSSSQDQNPSAAEEAKSQIKKKSNRSEREQQQAKEQWLRLIPDDPAYLLREKFLRDHLRRQNGDPS